MRHEELHKELVSFPKNQSLNEVKIKAISIRLQEEISSGVKDSLIQRKLGKYKKQGIIIIGSFLAITLFSFFLITSNMNFLPNTTAHLPGHESNSSTILSVENSLLVENYFESQVMKPNFGGKIFHAFKVLGTNDNEIYIWVLLEEYYKEGEDVVMGSGMSVPMVLEVSERENSIYIINHAIPGDGEHYVDDIKNLFPKKLYKQIINYPVHDVNELTTDIKKQVKKEFGQEPLH